MGVLIFAYECSLAGKFLDRYRAMIDTKKFSIKKKKKSGILEYKYL